MERTIFELKNEELNRIRTGDPIPSLYGFCGGDRAFELVATDIGFSVVLKFYGLENPDFGKEYTINCPMRIDLLSSYLDLLTKDVNTDFYIRNLDSAIFLKISVDNRIGANVILERYDGLKLEEVIEESYFRISSNPYECLFDIEETDDGSFLVIGKALRNAEFISEESDTEASFVFYNTMNVYIENDDDDKYICYNAEIKYTSIDNDGTRRIRSVHGSYDAKGDKYVILPIENIYNTSENIEEGEYFIIIDLMPYNYAKTQLNTQKSFCVMIVKKDTDGECNLGELGNFKRICVKKYEYIEVDEC